MKILVVQLLRLGDILMSAPILHGLRQKYPNAEIHFLGFKNFMAVQDLVKEKIIWHWIDRDELQSALRDADASFFRASDRLEQQLQPLRFQKFDRVVNLTQTVMSGWICTYIRGQSVIGWHYDERGNALFGSPWLRYLNDRMAAGKGEVFHYLDLFRYAAEVHGLPAVWNFRRDRAVSKLPSPYILAQVTTSDRKKNYPLDSWRRTFECFLKENPSYTIGVLAAPEECESLQSAFRGVEGVRTVPCSLPQALHLMDGAGALVTGDTSIKHLANASEVRVLEVSLGSSDIRVTGVYKAGSWIVQGQVPCGPCPHSSPCSQASHRCAEKIAPDELAGAIGAMLQNRPLPASQDGIRWMETSIAPTGIWMAKESSGGKIKEWIEKSTWKFVLQREFLNPLAAYGSESFALGRLFENHAGVRGQLDFLETAAVESDSELRASMRALERWLEKPLDDQRRRDCLEAVGKLPEPESVDGIGIWPKAGEKVVALTGLRKLQTRLEEIEKRNSIRLKLIRSVRSYIPEKQ